MINSFEISVRNSTHWSTHWSERLRLKRWRRANDDLNFVVNISFTMIGAREIALITSHIFRNRINSTFSWTKTA